MDIATAKDDEEIRHDGASTASPQSSSKLATSPSAFLSFSDHTFTPLSMDDDTNSEPYSEDGATGDSIRIGAKSAFGMRSSPHRDINGGMTAAIRTATRPTRPKSAGRGAAGKVMALVQSIDEHLHATTTAGPPQSSSLHLKPRKASLHLVPLPEPRLDGRDNPHRHTRAQKGSR